MNALYFLRTYMAANSFFSLKTNARRPISGWRACTYTRTCSPRVYRANVTDSKIPGRAPYKSVKRTRPERNDDDARYATIGRYGIGNKTIIRGADRGGYTEIAGPAERQR